KDVQLIVHRWGHGGGIERRAQLLDIAGIGIDQNDEQPAAHCSSISSTLSRRPHLSKKFPSLRTRRSSSSRASRSRSLSRALGLSSGPPFGAVTGKNDAPSQGVAAPANITVMSLQSTSSPMTLK